MVQKYGISQKYDPVSVIKKILNLKIYTNNNNT